MLAALSAALFGLATPISKYLLNGINAFSLAGLLYLGASVVLFPVILARKEYFYLFALNRANLLRLIGAVTLGGIIGPVLLLFALRQAPASSVSLWLNMELVATTLLGFVFFKDFLGKTGWAGVALALASGVLLTVNEGTSGIVPAVFVCAACVCWGFDNHFTSLIDGISAVQSTCIKGCIAGIINTAIGYFMPGPPMSAETAICALILGGVSYGISIVLYITSAQKLGAIRSQILFSAAPFFGFFFSMIFLSESISSLQSISFLLLIVSIMLMAFEKHEHRHEHHELEHTHLHRHDDLHHEHVHDIKIENHDHPHRHGRGVHSHPHWPDIHHRHDHG